MGCCTSENKNQEATAELTHNESFISKKASMKLYHDYNIPKNAIHVRLEANSSEQMFPLWIEVPSSGDTQVKFHVRGKWRVFENQGEVSSFGHTNISEKVDNYNIGALMGQVLGNEYFNILDEKVYNIKQSGPLIMFQNTGEVDTQPNGYLDIFIEGVKRRNIEEIERFLGWDIIKINTTNNHSYLTNEEKQMIILINKLRINPKLFAKLYLKPKLNRGEAYVECYEEISKMEQKEVFHPDKNLFTVAYNHAIDMGVNGLSGHFSSKGEDLKTRMLNCDIEPESIGENSSYGLNDPLEIVIQLLVDEQSESKGDRANLLSEEYNSIGLSIQSHSNYKWTCVQEFAFTQEES